MKKKLSATHDPMLPKLTIVASTPHLHNVLTSAINNQSCQLQTAHTARECLNVVDNSKIVFVDLILEDMDGLSLIEELRMRNKNMHIIAIVCKKELAAIEMSAENITLMASQSGANAVFTAPFNLGDLLATVERFLAPAPIEA